MLDEVERFTYGAVALTTKALAEVAGPTELTFLGWRVLVMLRASDQGMRLREVAERLGASAPSTSRLVRRLQRRGFVDTSRDAVDRRGLRVGLTPEGDSLLSAVLDRRRAMLEQALAEPLPPHTERVMAALADRLERWA